MLRSIADAEDLEQRRSHTLRARATTKGVEKTNKLVRLFSDPG